MTRLSRRSDESVFENPMMTPPRTNADTGTWDDSGPIRGWATRSQSHATLYDHVIEKHWKEHGLTCILLRVTEYYERFRHTRDRQHYGECETFYRGYVHAPDVAAFPKGYHGTYITDCYPDDGWYSWDERSWSNRPAPGESMRESALRKTRTLARGLKKHTDSEGNDD